MLGVQGELGGADGAYAGIGGQRNAEDGGRVAFAFGVAIGGACFEQVLGGGQVLFAAGTLVERLLVVIQAEPSHGLLQRLDRFGG